MPANIIEKIWQSHVVKQAQGHPAVLAIDLMLLHEVTSAQAFETLAQRNLPVSDPNRLIATLDHSIPTDENRRDIKDDEARNQVHILRQNCLRHKIPLIDFDQGQGIVHVIGPELGLTQPGMTIVCGDSHTSTHGAFGALAFGIGTSEVAHVLATGCLLQEKPKTMKVEFRGQFRKGVFAKDAILALINKIDIGGAAGHIIEYCGPAISVMGMEERMTVCNMSIECGARAGLVAPDESTFAYLKGRPYALDDWPDAINYWQSLVSDANAIYDQQIVIDLNGLYPIVTWGTNPGQSTPINKSVPFIKEMPEKERAVAQSGLNYTGLKEGSAITDTAIDWAFVGSCTNGRIEDLRIVAKILSGNHIHPSVTMYIVPGSEAVLKQVKAEKLDAVFSAAGAQLRQPGCSMCIAMNDDRVPAGKHCISSSNRNFQGRQGPGSITHLASPATVAASAIAGHIASPEQYFK